MSPVFFVFGNGNMAKKHISKIQELNDKSIIYIHDPILDESSFCDTEKTFYIK